MKVSKLFKSKKVSLMSMAFLFMYVFGFVSMTTCAIDFNLSGCMSYFSYVLSVLGWHITYRKLLSVRSACDSISKANDELIVVNRQLKSRYSQQLSITQGVISENIELKNKLKNVKMENSRIRREQK